MLTERARPVLSPAGRPVPPGPVRAAKIFMVCFVLLLPLVAIGCSRGTDRLYGIWGTGSGGKLTYRTDGTGTYVNSDASQKYESRFTIDKRWADGKGGTWYRLKERWHLPPYQDVGAVTIYKLGIIDAAGMRMESEQSESDYPSELHGAAGAGHDLFTRQQ